MLGFDTLWEDAISDGDLVRRALAENRYILTLDKRLPEDWRVANVLLLKAENPFEQLRETIARFKIRRPRELFTRCLICNELLRAATNEEIAAEVPGAVRAQQQTFQRCANCCKIYWAGSHTARMKKAIEDLFDREFMT